MEGNGNGNQPTPSRLSPLAQPFSLNPFTRQSTWSSLTKVDPFSNFTMEDDHESRTAMGAVCSHNLFDFSEDAGFTEYPSANAGSDSGVLLLASNECLPNYTELSSYGHSQAGFSGYKNASSAYETLLEQGKPAVKGSKPYGESSEKAEKCSDLAIGSENQFISRSPDQVDAGHFSFSEVKSMASPYDYSMSVTSSTSMLQNSSQTQLPYTAPAVTLSHRNSKIAFCESGKKFDSYRATSTVCDSPKHNAFPALVLKSSDSSTTVSPLNPVLSKNVDSKGNCADDSSSQCSPSGVKDLYHLMSVEGKEIHHDESPNDRGKGSSGGKPILGIGPLLTETSQPLINLTNTHDDFSLGHPGTKEAVSLATKLDENDSDLDSPCWKGTLASRQFPFGVPRSMSSDFVETEQEGRNSLNPLAPHFFPRHTKSLVNYHASDYVGDDFSSFQSSESTAVKSFSKGRGPVDQAGSSYSLSINGIGTQSSIDIHELGRANGLLNNSESGSVLKSAEALSKLKSTHSKRDVSFSKGHGSVDQAGSKSSFSINGIGTLYSNEIHELERVYAPLNNSDSGFVLNSPEGLSKLSTHSKKDVQTILNVMHYLSELLVKNCVDDLDSINDHNHDLIKHIINNLYMCFQQRAGGKTPICDITITGTQHSPNKSTELHKVECSDKGFQVTSSKAFAERMLDSFSSCRGIGTEKSNDIIQVMGNALRDNHMTKEELDPQALVYKKLWLESQAELRSLKYETCVLCMQLEMGGRKLDRNKVSGKLLTREMH